MSSIFAALPLGGRRSDARRGDALAPPAPRPAWRSRDLAAWYCVLEFASCFIGAGAALFFYPYETMHWRQEFWVVVCAALVASGSLVVWSILRGQYRRCVTQPGVSVVGSAVAAALRGAAVLIVLLFITKMSDILSRGSVLCLVAVVTAMVVIGRSVLSIWSHRMILNARMFTERTIVLGELSRLAMARDQLGFFDRLKRGGIKVTSIHSWPPTASEKICRKLMLSVVEKSRAGLIDSVVLLPTAATISVAEQLVDAFAETPLTIHVVPLTSLSGASPAGTSIAGQSSIIVTNSPIQSLTTALKRGFDIVAASTLLFLLAPLLVGVALAIKLESKGPVFFRQTRHGYGKSQFKVFKFRSMRVMEDGAAFRQARKNDPRVTRVGRFIRRSNLDELPQLLNVILGDMSLVGPRPHPVALNDDFAARIRMFHRRHNIRPGITGWAQVNGFRGETDTDVKMQKRVEHDLWYVDNWSFLLDLRILVFTLISPAAYKNAG